MRRGLTARVFDECDGMSHLLSWLVTFLQVLQEKALLHVQPSDPTREQLLAIVGGSLQACEAELEVLRDAAPRRLPTQQRLADVSLLLLAGAWFYRAWDLGGAARGSSGLPLLDGLDAARSRLMPPGCAGIEMALALMLLAAALSRVVMARVVQG